MKQYIVAEISKNWDLIAGSRSPLWICQQFEVVIETNLGRGYRLHSFQLHRAMTGPTNLNETIIAVFEAIPPQD